jgi:hypothetical protein
MRCWELWRMTSTWCRVHVYKLYSEAYRFKFFTDSMCKDFKQILLESALLWTGFISVLTSLLWFNAILIYFAV